MNTSDTSNCDCCEGILVQTPREITNPPGLPAISYRVGNYTQFKQSMEANIADYPGLSDLKTRQASDFTLALFDAWAMVSDVLTFYQERIANEGYVSTATERNSLTDLAKMVGYQLQPGVAANTYLTFTLEDALGSPTQTTIPAGTKVQSLPEPGENPQIFETTQPIEARTAWNAIRPIATQQQYISQDSLFIWLNGTNTNLRPGDTLLIIGQYNGKTEKLLHRVQMIKPDNVKQQTLVVFEGYTVGTNVSSSLAAIESVQAHVLLVPTGATSASELKGAFAKSQALTNTTVQQYVLNKPVRQADLQALALVNKWSVSDVIANMQAQAQAKDQYAQPDIPEDQRLLHPHIFVLRLSTSLFGYNAAQWNTLPAITQQVYIQAYKTQNPNDTRNSNQPSQWPDWPFTPLPANQLDLNTRYSQILKDSWIVVRKQTSQGEKLVSAQVERAHEVGTSRFGMSGKVTRLQLRGTDIEHLVPVSVDELRQTTVYMQSEELFLADVPTTAPVQDKNNNIVVAGVFEGLRRKQWLAISGERTDFVGTTSSELAVLNDVRSYGGNFSILTLESPLAYTYKAGTVVINANVTLATQGESIEDEVLGDGDASVPYQRFTLQQSPLTYVQASTANGKVSTLHITVNDLPWREVLTFENQGPRDRVFVTHIEDDGTVTVQFGDGINGARLPTGEDNVVANYRKGTGLQGLLKPGQLNLLMTRPLGVKSVSNPLAPTGADDPETVEDARRNAATTVFTLGRVVSQEDYEQFTRSFAGVAKTQARVIWNDSVRCVYVTIAGPPTDDFPNGTEITRNDGLTGGLYAKIQEELQQASDPFVPFRLQSYTTVLFRMSAYVTVDPLYDPKSVFDAVEKKMLAYFSFSGRDFGQSVTMNEVLGVMQIVDGVVTATIHTLYRVGEPEVMNETLNVKSIRVDTKGRASQAELLILDPRQPFDTLEEPT